MTMAFTDTACGELNNVPYQGVFELIPEPVNMLLYMAEETSLQM